MTTQSEFNLDESNHMLEDNKIEESLNVQLNLHEINSNDQVSSSEDNNESFFPNENLSMECDFKDGQKGDYVSENLDSALDSESNESDTTTSTTDKRLSETITYQQKIIEHNANTIKGLEEKVNCLESIKQELSAKLERVKQYIIFGLIH